MNNSGFAFQPLSISDNPPEDMAFISWPWDNIRRVVQLIGAGTLLGLLIVVVAMIITMPKKCNPHQAWWQGVAFYEISIAEFQVSPIFILLVGQWEYGDL